MRCKRHTADCSSSNNGVCASCLRERLLYLAAYSAVEDNNFPQSLIFPCSVSPYVTRRRSDAGVTTSNRRFIRYSCKEIESKEGNKITGFSNQFRAKSENFDSKNPKLSSSSSRSWISTIFSTNRRKKQSNTASDVISGRRPQRLHCKGMSPARDSSELMEELRKTPATKTPGRKKSIMSGVAFWLGPLVRASPNFPFKRKMKSSSDFGNSGENTVPEKPHISEAASFCANRSKKLVDLGRLNRHR